MHEAPKIELAVGRKNASEPKIESNEAPEIELDAEGGGVKALCGAAQEWRHLLDGSTYALRSTFTAPNVRHSLCLRFPHTEHLARELMLCLHPTIAASALDIIARLGPDQHSPCTGT